MENPVRTGYLDSIWGGGRGGGGGVVPGGNAPSAKR